MMDVSGNKGEVRDAEDEVRGAVTGDISCAERYGDRVQDKVTAVVTGARWAVRGTVTLGGSVR